MGELGDIFSFKEDPKRIKEGVVLVSEPLGRDLFFKKSVILIVEHNAHGTIGFVLNKPILLPLKELFTEFPEVSDNISLGGPVEPNTLHFIHTLGNKLGEGKKITTDTFWGGDFEKMQLLFKAGLIDKRQIKFFVGYSGWSPDQLAEEIEQSQWVITNLPVSKIISSGYNLWDKCIESLGQRFKPWLNVPEEPALN